MRIQIKHISKKILMILIALTAFGAMSLSAMAYNDYDSYDTYESHDYQETERAANMLERLIVSFNPGEGSFPASEVQDGVRWPLPGEVLSDIPPDPVREGYIFDGWQCRDELWLLETESITVNRVMEFTALWRVDDGSADSSPPPDASPAPTASPAPSPPAGASPSPSPSPTPQSATSPNNPATNPIAISFLIFGAVLALGITAFGIIKVTARHKAAAGQYDVDATRYKRESRLVHWLEDENLNE